VVHGVLLIVVRVDEVANPDHDEIVCLGELSAR
jgi:hypothetical protein